MKINFYSMRQEELAEKVYGSGWWKEVSSVRQPILELMRRVDGAELINEHLRKADEVYSAAFFITPEAVYVGFESVNKVDVVGVGATQNSLDLAKKKIGKALETPSQ